jgi:DNA-binding NarL/FixJ family response regulator
MGDCRYPKQGTYSLAVRFEAWEAIDGLALTCPVVLLAPGEGRKAVPSGTRLEVSAILPRKDITGEQVIVAVRAAAAGLRVESEPDEGLPSDAPLDERRLQVLRLLAEGADTRTIARRLTYSERTVKTLIRDLELALGAQNRAQAVAEGLRRGII